MGVRWVAVGAAVVGIAAEVGVAAGQTEQTPQNLRARVEGTFAMTGRITAAVNVRGERRGDSVKRTWRIAPLGCMDAPVACPRLRLTRRRSGGRQLRIVLDRRSNGAYRGHGSFFVPLRCYRRIYRHGSRARYLITLRVTESVIVNGFPFATGIRASYFNGSRSDFTPCPLGPSHDAALYRGVLSPQQAGQ